MNKKITALFIAVLVISMLFAGCANDVEKTAETAATSKPPSQDIVNETDEDTGMVTIIDVLGNELVAPKIAPTKIVSLTPANTELLFALGLGEYVIGVDANSNYPAETADIEKIGDFNGPNVEAILALEPDLILAGNKLQIDAVSQLVELGISVAAVETTRYEEIFESIKLVGDLTMTSDKAQELIDQMRAEEQEIIAKVEEYKGEAISVYYVMSAGEFGNWTSGPESYIDDMFKLLKLETITDLEVTAPWMDFSLETLVAKDPDILIVVENEFLNADMLSGMEGYKELTAVKEGRAYNVNEDILSRASVRIIQALDILYKTAYEN